MAGTTAWIISNLLSSIQKLSQFMHPFPSIPASSSSSSSIEGDRTASDVHSIQEKLMEDLSRLPRMLRRIQAVLHDAEEREIYEKSIQLWLSELREVAYDAEDVLDKYDYQVIKTQVEGMTVAAEAEHSLKRKHADDDDDDDDDDLYDFQVSPSSSTLTKIPISCNMAKRIMNIIEKFDEIAKDREALQFREEDGIRLSTFDDAMKRPMSSSLVNDYDIFGREDDKKKIIQLLMSNSEKENTVITIVGLGGVGKTTLAQLVYNDHAVCEHFSPKVWVCVSEKFDVLRVTKEIVKSINKSSNLDDNNNLNDLQCMLKEALLEKRFLLILDDVWNERPDMWESLYAPFLGVGMGKIIVTTRSMSVAQIMQTVPPHELGCLDNEKSWLLFQRHAFCGWELDQQLNFEHIGREISKKCGGLPLALKAIGGFLRYEVEEQIWKDVLNNNLWELEETKNLILPALRISYNHMPGYLKPCFVYASLFPKGHWFKKDEMIGMWMAQGYIQLTKRKLLLEDIAFEYFIDLQRRSFFQCSIYDEGFTLHDMVHDLARSIAKNEIYSSLNFDELKNIDKDAKHIFLKDACADHVPLLDAIRTIYRVTWTHQYNLLGFFCYDSIAIFGCLRVLNLDASDLECNLQIVDMIGNLHQLRYLRIKVDTIQMAKYSLCNLYKLQTLKLISKKLNMLPSAMNKLINLRQLVIQCHTLHKMPKSIVWIENLLTLDISYISSLRSLPLGISKLTNLRHLILPEIDNFYIPCEIERMISLQTLSNYHVQRFREYSSIRWLKHLMNLRGSLEISNLENVVSREDAMSANLQSKPYIECLHLSWTYFTKAKENTSLQEEAVLDGLQPHTNLKELMIDGYGGNSFPRWFGNSHLSNLIKISLKNFKNYKEWKFLPISGFPSLRSLELCNINGLRRMEQDFWCYNAPPVDHDSENNVEEVHAANKNMPEWKKCPTMKHGDFSTLKYLTILKCQELKQLSTLPSSLEELTINGCRKLEYLALNDSFGPLSRLQKLTVTFCSNLKSMKSLNNLLTNIKFLDLLFCLQLQLDPDEYSDRTFASTSLEFTFVSVNVCPKMKDWCRWHGFPYNSLLGRDTT